MHTISFCVSLFFCFQQSETVTAFSSGSSCILIEKHREETQKTENEKPKYAIINIKGIKSKTGMASIYRHIYRTKEVTNADPERTKFNRELIRLEQDGFVQAFNKIVKEENIKIRHNNTLTLHKNY